MQRLINDYTAHERHIFINNKYTYIHNNSTNTQHKHINTYTIFFYLLAAIVVINFVKKRMNKYINLYYK